VSELGVLMSEVAPCFRFRDTGCEMSPSCLSCPLPICKHDDPKWAQRGRVTWVASVYEAHDRSVARTAEAMGVTRRSVHRALAIWRAL
jgi:hypothetical protein